MSFKFMGIQLIIQLIILATAIVGLFKAATYKPGGSKAKKSDGSAHPLVEIFSGLLSFVGVFAFMLVMPAFIWVFVAIMDNIDVGGASDKSEIATPQYSLPYTVSAEPSGLEIMLVAASQIPYHNSRGDALEKVTEKALARCDIRLALAAATAIPYENSRGAVLEKVMNVAGTGRCDKKPINETQPTE